MDTVDSCSAFKHHWRLWTYLGLVPPARGSRWRLPYLMYAVVVNCTAPVAYAVGMTVQTFLSPDFDEACKSVFVTMAALCNVIKSFNVYMNFGQLLKFHVILTRLDKRVHSAEERKILQSAADSAYFFLRSIVGIYIASVFFGETSVLLSSEPQLIYPIWLPWDWRKHFKLSNIYQLYAAIGTALYIASNDCYIQAYLRMLAAQIRALSWRVSRLGQQLDDTWPEVRGNAIMTEQQQFEELAACIKDHQAIIELFEIIRNGISHTVLVQFVSSSISQCTIGAFIIFRSLTYIDLITCLMVLVDVTVQILLICYFSELVCTESENLTSAIYSCNWKDQSVRFQKALAFFLQRSQKIEVMLAANVIPVNLPGFVQIIKTSYSIFTLLSNVK